MKYLSEYQLRKGLEGEIKKSGSQFLYAKLKDIHHSTLSAFMTGRQKLSDVVAAKLGYERVYRKIRK